MGTDPGMPGCSDATVFLFKFPEFQTAMTDYINKNHLEVADIPRVTVAYQLNMLNKFRQFR